MSNQDNVAGPKSPLFDNTDDLNSENSISNIEEAPNLAATMTEWRPEILNSSPADVINANPEFEPNLKFQQAEAISNSQTSDIAQEDMEKGHEDEFSEGNIESNENSTEKQIEDEGTISVYPSQDDIQEVCKENPIRGLIISKNAKGVKMLKPIIKDFVQLDNEISPALEHDDNNQGLHDKFDKTDPSPYDTLAGLLEPIPSSTDETGVNQIEEIASTAFIKDNSNQVILPEPEKIGQDTDDIVPVYHSANINNIPVVFNEKEETTEDKSNETFKKSDYNEIVILTAEQVVDDNAIHKFKTIRHAEECYIDLREISDHPQSMAKHMSDDGVYQCKQCSTKPNFKAYASFLNHRERFHNRCQKFL